MPRADIEAQIAALQKQLEDDDEGTELWVRDEKGRETKLTGAHAKKWLRQLGLEDDEEPQDGTEAEGPDGGDGQQDPPARGNSVWGRK